jgi:prolyl-tRNA editing enzyme YbaK/EbsC (Cys-tRNA(Pro) deacylase)
LSSAIERFGEAATAAGLSLEITRFTEGTRTAADAARAIGCEVGQIVKSLVFMADGRPFLALTSGSNRADPERLAGLVGARDVHRANPEEAREATGYAIGGTPPFGHPRNLAIVFDRDLLSYEVVWAAAGTPDSVFPIAPGKLLRITKGQVGDFKEEG